MNDRALDGLPRRGRGASSSRALAEFVAFASISSSPDASRRSRAALEWLQRQCREAGFEQVRAFPTSGNPIVLATLASPIADAPTVLIYGHYDVQPVDAAEWQTPPFSPEIRDGCMYGRGVSDNKAPIMINLSALRACLELDGSAPCNLVYVIEGDEERTAEPLREFSAEHGDLLAADVLHVADSWMHEPGVPAVTTAVRGMAALEFSVSTARWNLHSGTYGGAVPNAVSVLAGLLAGLHDASGRVAVAGFYDRGRRGEQRGAGALGRVRARARRLPRGDRQPLPRRRDAVLAARADLGAADARDQRRVGRLPGRGDPHDRAGQGERQDHLPAGGRAGSAGGHRPDRRAPAAAHPARRRARDREHAGRLRPALDARRLARGAGRGRGARGRLGAPGRRGPRGLLGPGRRDHGAPRRRERVPDGVRARGRAGARARRALPPRELPQGHRGDRRLLARATPPPR